MHEIERFGGRRVRENETSCIVVQFNSEYNLDRWVRAMRATYNQDQFGPFINRPALVVAY